MMCATWERTLPVAPVWKRMPSYVARRVSVWTGEHQINSNICVVRRMNPNHLITFLLYFKAGYLLHVVLEKTLKLGCHCFL